MEDSYGDDRDKGVGPYIIASLMSHSCRQVAVRVVDCAIGRGIVNTTLRRAVVNSKVECLRHLDQDH